MCQGVTVLLHGPTPLSRRDEMKGKSWFHASIHFDEIAPA